MEVCQQEQSWFALQVRPRHELAAARMLRTKGFEEFVPTYSTKQQWSDRQKNVTFPLFAGYVFCKFYPVKKLPIINTACVIRIVGNNRGPSAIADQEIDVLRKAVQSGLSVRPHPYITAGSKVRIQEGSMAGVEGIFIGQKKGSEMII